MNFYETLVIIRIFIEAAESRVFHGSFICLFFFLGFGFYVISSFGVG